ncbi:MAG: hypothetical protein K2X81_22850 [Candidatus Obscuribacterales bacterium]|nr:hypothetical protein [Candidatus Obscuribacterales bacterium]
MGFGGFNRMHYLLNNQASSSSNQDPQPVFGRESLLGPNPNPTFFPPFGGYIAPSIGGLDLLTALATPKKSAVHQAFKQCLANIELDQTRTDQASQHYNSIKNWLESRISGVQIRRVGSFQKHTKIRPVTINGIASPIDIDAIVCFGDATGIVSYGGTTGDSCLQIVRNALVENHIYKLLKPVVDHPVVTLSYASEFFIELVPCYRNRLDSESIARIPASYLVCNSQNDWEHADYDYDSAYITEANKLADQKLVPAIKLIKQFVRNRELGIKSFQVEILCVQLLVPRILELKLANQTWEWQDMIAYFLQNASQILWQNLSLPGSRTKIPAIVDPFSLGMKMKEWGDLFASLRSLPPSNATLQAYKLCYGDRFPTP